jgi:hypothetical protein
MGVRVATGYRSSTIILSGDDCGQSLQANCFPLATLKKIAATRMATALFARVLP